MVERQKVEVHIIIGCADSRDLSSAFLDAKEELIKEKAAAGTLIDIQRISAAGSFVTEDVKEDVIALLREKAKEYYETNDVSFFIHVNTHGDGKLREGVTKAYDIKDFDIEETAKFNCGMLNATEVAAEMQELLLRKQPVFTINGRKIAMDSEAALDQLLSEKYGHNERARGPFNNWIVSIGDLRVHARDQLREIRDAIKDAVEFTRLRDRIFYTAGVQDYADSEYFRVDGQHNLQTLLDEVYERAAEKLKLKKYREEREVRIANQKPVLGLIHMGQIGDARELAVEIAVNDLRRKLPPDVIDGLGDFRSGLVFAMSSMRMDSQFAPFDPYQVTGFYYGIKYLGLKDWIVMGINNKQTDRMMIRKDGPLMRFFAQELGVTFHPVSSEDYLTGGRNGRKPKGLVGIR